MEEFGVFVAQPDVYRGRAVKLAGRIVGVESTEKGTLIVAEWLPYPQKGQYGPGANEFTGQNRFKLLYPGVIDPWSSWQGNRFVMTGNIEGTQNMVASFTGASKSVPYMVARCIHVWEVGDNTWWDQPDTEPGGYPYLQHTYCANKEGDIS
jgi:starvation-inducible outer membrane lipoprotein